MPAISGLWNSSGVLQYSGFTYNYANVSSPVPTLTCTEIHTMDGIDYNYGIWTIQPFFSNGTGFQFGIPVGTVIYIGDFLSEVFANKVVALFNLISFVITPANFNILGFTIADLGGQALMLVIGIYILCYLAIAAMIYSLILGALAGAM